MKPQELKNGRLAMIGAAGALVQEALTGETVFARKFLSVFVFLFLDWLIRFVNLSVFVCAFLL